MSEFHKGRRHLLPAFFDTRKPKPFASTAALLNFMEANNWEHYDSLVQRDNQTTAFYFYFRKKR